MSKSNGKQPLEIELAQATSTTIPTVKPREENDSLGVPGINQPDVTTGNLSHSNKASTSAPNICDITEVNQTLYDVDESDDWAMRHLLDSAKRGQNRSKQSPTICKVPRSLRDHSESSYKPQLVSIGPIHCQDEKLQEFRWLKDCYLHDFLQRCEDSTPKDTLKACMLEVRGKITQIRESYAERTHCIDNDDGLAWLTILDGCFILEFCLKHQEINLYLPDKMQTNRIAMDLILLENQIPFFVLQDLFDCSMGKRSCTLSYVLNKCLAPYIKLFRSLLPEEIPTTDIDSDSTHDHVLGYLHKRCQLVAAKSSKPTDAETSKSVDEELAAKSSNPTDAEELKLIVDEDRIENTYTAHSIVELDRAGMDFQPHQEDEWLMTVKSQPSLFPCLPRNKPALLMPTLVINYSTELILRNFIAYEQLIRQDLYYFTSYAHAMDMLIDTQEDIAKLVESKVLVNRLGSNQEAADMINKVCKNISITDFYYIQAFKQMDKYYNGWSSTYIAWLKRAYTNNPFFFIALTAAIILFLLTVVQTLFTVLGYFADGSNQ